MRRPTSWNALRCARDLWQAGRPYLILALLGGALVWPLMGPDVPCTHDGQLYYYQAAAMCYSVEHGLIYSRWLPDAALGYGIPLLNYREPLPRYLVLGLVLLGVTVPRALNLVSALSILSVGWGTYRLARDVFDDDIPGFVAGIAAMSAPYILMNVYRRGALPESVALALIPWALWLFWKITVDTRPRSGAVVGAALAWGALLLSHNISALLFAPVLAAYVLLLGRLTSRAAVGARHAWPLEALTNWLWPGVSYLAGLGLAAFYWAPAFFERNLIQIWRATATRNNRYVFNFVSPAEVFRPPEPYNPAWLNPSLTIQLGLVMALLALVGIVVGWLTYRDRVRRVHIAGFTILASVCLIMSFAVSRPIWDAIPILAFVQFPWRLVGQAILPVAVLAGAGIGAALRRLDSRPCATGVTTGIVAAVLIVGGLPATYPHWCPSLPYPTIVDVNRFEQDSLVGLDNEGSYFPAGAVPPKESPLLADYEAGRTPRRFDETTVPQDAVFDVMYYPLGAQGHIETPETFTARYLTYAFPGWGVWIDGQRTEILPEPESGLITFPVPSGVHEIEVLFVPTLLRFSASVVSILSLIGLVGLTLIGRRVPRHSPHLHHELHCRPSSWVTLASVGIIMMIARVAWRGDLASPWRVAASPVPQYEQETVFEGQVRLLGYDLGSHTVRADEELRVDTYWERISEVTGDTQVALLVLDERGFIWSEKEGFPTRGSESPPLPTFAWPPDTFVTDSQMIRLIPGTPPGQYTLAVALFDPDTLEPFAAALPAEGVTTQVPLRTIEVGWPRQFPDVDVLGIQYPLEAQLGELTLLGCNLDREEVWLGETALITLFWETLVDVPEVPPIVLTLDGESITAVASSRPTESIPAGATWREQYFLRIPAEAEAGEHMIGVVTGDEEPISLEAIAVRALTRTFEPQPVELEVDALFGGSARLVGLTISSEGNQLTTTLIWEAEASTSTSYTVFVHVLDADGNIIAQSDKLPSNGARPTTGWLPGEYITDIHTLVISPDRVIALRIGLYDALTGVRLQLADHSDAVLISLDPLAITTGQ